MGVAKPLPPVERLRELLDYDPMTGEFRWRVNRRGRGARKGQPAGTWKPDGYLSIMVDRKRYPAQRLAWKIITGEEPGPVVDHEDGDTTNNKFRNLRNADLRKNAHNAIMQTNNTTGYKGVSLHKPSGLYRALVAVDHVTHSFGYYRTAEEANLAAIAGRRTLHAEFSCDSIREAA